MAGVREKATAAFLIGCLLLLIGQQLLLLAGLNEPMAVAAALVLAAVLGSWGGAYLERMLSQSIGEVCISQLGGEHGESEELKRRLVKLERLSLSASSTAHEVRNALTAAQGMTQLLEAKNREAGEYTGLIREELQRANRLLSSLLQFTRPEWEMEPLDLNSWLLSFLTVIEAEAERRGVQVEKELGDQLPLVNIDRERLKQVVLNLCSNAYEAAGRGGRLVIRTYHCPLENWVALEVKDDGCGIDPERLDHLFQPFFTTRKQGTGLGLAITEQIVREHGGWIKVGSEVNRGSTFTVFLPALESGQGPAALAAAPDMTDR